MKTVSLFSGGVSSAVATKLVISEVDEVFYTHIEDQHPDTMRFVNDCAEWFGKPVRVWQSKYKSVENACLGAGGKGYIRGVAGAPCTKFLKRRVRREWELEQMERGIKLCYVWGFDSTEGARADRLRGAMPEMEHLFPLIEQDVSKEHAHQILRASGIERPFMYGLGYLNNNCVGCVKGGIGYWNKIRVDFPEVFWARAKLERRIGSSILKQYSNELGKCVDLWLDELDPQRGRKQKPICDDCGIFCELEKIA